MPALKLPYITQITDQDIREHFPGCAITTTTREVYVRAIRKVRYIICTGNYFNNFDILFQKKKKMLSRKQTSIYYININIQFLQQKSC